MAIMCVAYIFISLSFQFCNGIFLYSVLKFLFILSLFCILEYMEIFTFHILSVFVWKDTFLRYRGKMVSFAFSVHFWHSLPSGIPELSGKEQTGSTGVWRKVGKERTKAIWENSLTIFSNLNHVRKSKHLREENGNRYLVRHKTPLK